MTYLIFYTIPVNPGCQVVPCGPHTTTTPAQLRAANHAVGADQPVLVQYGRFIWRLVHDGSLGTTFADRLPVRTLITDALPTTASIVLGGAAILLLLAIPLAVLSARRPRSALDRGVLLVSLFGIALHPFVVGLTLRGVFAKRLGLAPDSGYCTLTPSAIPCSGPAGWASHLALPWITFALFFLPLYVRMLRARVLEAMSEPHVLVARAKGASELRLIRSHILRTAMTPVVAMLATDLGTAVTAAIYIETVFAMPGIGLLTLNALSGSIGGYDLPTVVGVVVTVAIAIVVLNLCADIVTATLDPRIRLRRTSGFIPIPAGVARVTGRVDRVVPEPVRAAIVVAALAGVVALVVVHQSGSKKQGAPSLPAEARRRIKLGWDENVTFSGHVGVRLRFRVASVAVGKRSWVVRGEVLNTSKRVLNVLPPRNTSSTDAGPSLLVPEADFTSGRAALHVRPATVVEPPLPQTLAPGQRWSGTWGGTGKVPRQTLIYVGFGQFQVPNDANESPIAWNSTDSFRLQ